MNLKSQNFGVRLFLTILQRRLFSESYFKSRDSARGAILLIDAKEGEKILDAACGTGDYAAAFVKRGAQVWGLDLSEGMLKIAKQKVPSVQLQQGNLEKKLPYDIGFFDKICCGQALKHLKDIKECLKEFHRILKDKGILVFSVTHPEMNWQDYEMKENPEFILSQESDIYPYRFADYFSAFEESGFQIDQVKQVAVSERIKHLLTEKSFRKVEGRYQIIIFRLKKSFM